MYRPRAIRQYWPSSDWTGCDTNSRATRSDSRWEDGETPYTGIDLCPVEDPLAKLGWPFCGGSSEAPNCPVARSAAATALR
jgi:hypothetical protein